MTPSRYIGYALMAAALCVLLVCLYLSIRAGDLAGPLAVWVIACLALYIGLYRVARFEPVDEAEQKRRRRRLVLVFMIYYAVIGSVFLVFHIFFSDPPRPSFMTYTPVMLFAAIISYIPFYLLSVRKIGLMWTSVTVPIVFVLGMFSAPLFLIGWYDEFTAELDTVDAAAVTKTTSEFLVIRNIELKPEYSQEWYQRSLQINAGSTDSHLVEFVGLVPIATGRPDTLFTLWVELSSKDFLDGDLDESEVRKLEQEFIDANRDRVARLTMDSIKFFHRATNNSILSGNNYPLRDQSIVLKPVYTDFAEYRSQMSRDFLGMLLIIIPVFWGVSMLGKR